MDVGKWNVSIKGLLRTVVYGITVITITTKHIGIFKVSCVGYYSPSLSKEYFHQLIFK